MIYIRGNRARLRRVGGAGPRRLGLRGRPAVLQARRGQRARREPLPRRRRAAQRQRRAARCTRSSRRASRPRARPASRRNDDLNGATQDGAGRYQVTQRDGRRCSDRRRLPAPGASRAATSTCSPTRSSTRILFEGKRAVGVEIMRDGALEQVRAEREVILCGGRLPLAAAADALRRRAGRRRSRRWASRPATTCPVGQNLQDHLMLDFVCLTDKGA